MLPGDISPQYQKYGEKILVGSDLKFRLQSWLIVSLPHIVSARWSHLFLKNSLLSSYKLNRSGGSSSGTQRLLLWPPLDPRPVAPPTSPLLLVVASLSRERVDSPTPSLSSRYTNVHQSLPWIVNRECCGLWAFGCVSGLWSIWCLHLAGGHFTSTKGRGERVLVLVQQRLR